MGANAKRRVIVTLISKEVDSRGRSSPHCLLFLSFGFLKKLDGISEK